MFTDFVCIGGMVLLNIAQVVTATLSTKSPVISIMFVDGSSKDYVFNSHEKQVDAYSRLSIKALSHF